MLLAGCGGVGFHRLVCLHAAKLPSVKDEIARLRSEARLFVGADIEAIILADAGETSGIV